jgi:lipoate-protein ligase B
LKYKNINIIDNNRGGSVTNSCQAQLMNYIYASLFVEYNNLDSFDRVRIG